MRFVLGFTLCAASLAFSGVRLSADPGELTTSLADQRRVNVTIYNGDLALVHDRRSVSLAQGENHLAWRDVSANLDGTSALLESITAPGSVSVIEQNFDFDLLSPQAVLLKAVGHDVIVEHHNPLPGQPVRETAKLLSANNGVVLQFADRVETELNFGSGIVYSSLPPNLRERPTLVLDVDNARSGGGELELSYLTSGLGWHAEYVGQVAGDGKFVDLNGLVTLTNTSGATYRDAHVQLVAGNVNAPPPGPVPAMPGTVADTYVQSPVRQENFYEYHLYTLPRPTTIAENQTKQVAFMSAHRVPLHPTLELRGSSSYYTQSGGDLGQKLPVGAYLSFENKGGQLGVPLPGGIVRLYKADSRGISQFLGADRIEHTPKNEIVRLHVGDSFDVTARKKQTNFRVLGNATYESAYEIVLGNAKTEPVDVEVVEPIPGDWTILAENLRHKKSSSDAATWLVRVPAGGHVTLSYAVRVRY